jgi:hypothetical protein
MRIDALKNFIAMECDSVEVLMGLEANLIALAAGYDKRQLQIPEWIGERLTEIDSRIKGLVMAERKAEIKKLQAQEAALMGREEKRAAVAARIKALEALL